MKPEGIIREAVVTYKVRGRKAKPIIINSDVTAFEALTPWKLWAEPREKFFTITMDGAGHLLSVREVAVGSSKSVHAEPKEVFHHAVVEGACSVVLAHNHPSGDRTPSQGDKEITLVLVHAGGLLGIPVIDHLVIGHKEFTSIRGLWPELFSSVPVEEQ